MSRKCVCQFANPVECARYRHVNSVDDFEREQQRTEAECFGEDDGCECSCHDDYPGYEEDE